mgnify:CR=1 FL=1
MDNRQKLALARQKSKIHLKAKPINNSFINNFDNNNGRINYNGNLKSVSRFKFSKKQLNKNGFEC